MVNRAEALSWPRSDRPATGRPAENAPAVILTFSYSGAEILSDFLADSAALSCTVRSGLLPMCESVVATWQEVERREQLSALAKSSIRALVSSMAMARSISAGAHLDDSGPPRWCETAVSSTSSARAFLRVFPQAQFVCFYRRCEDVITETLESNPWGLGNTEFWAYSGADPGNSVAAAGAYWAERTRALLDFQAAQPRSCLSLRREDLDADAPEQLRLVRSFLGLTPAAVASALPGHPGVQREAQREVSPRFPADRLPPRLRTVINEVSARLGYPAL
jgi:hypothetical protein